MEGEALRGVKRAVGWADLPSSGSIRSGLVYPDYTGSIPNKISN